HREGHSTGGTTIPLNAFFLDPFWIGIPLVTSMQVDHPRTTAGTHRPQSFELVFPELDRELFPKSPEPFKPLSFGLHDSTPTPLLLTVQSHAPASIQSATKVPAHVPAEGSGLFRRRFPDRTAVEPLVPIGFLGFLKHRLRSQTRPRRPRPVAQAA